jgi:hypothetical protein
LMCFLAKRRRRRACERTMRCLRRASRTRSATNSASLFTLVANTLCRERVHSLRYFNHRLPFERGATRRRGSFRRGLLASMHYTVCASRTFRRLTRRRATKPSRVEASLPEASVRHPRFTRKNPTLGKDRPAIAPRAPREVPPDGRAVRGTVALTRERGARGPWDPSSRVSRSGRALSGARRG